MWTFLVAEDDARLADTIAEAARRRVPGLKHARIATTAPAALALLDEIPVEDGHRLVVLSDYNLRHPTLSGLDVLAHARRRHPRAVRVLMSGEDPARILESSESARIPDRFVEKPFLVHELLAALPFGA